MSYSRAPTTTRLHMAALAAPWASHTSGHTSSASKVRTVARAPSLAPSETPERSIASAPVPRAMYLLTKPHSDPMRAGADSSSHSAAPAGPASHDTDRSPSSISSSNSSHTLRAGCSVILRLYGLASSANHAAVAVYHPHHSGMYASMTLCGVYPACLSSFTAHPGKPLFWYTASPLTSRFSAIVGAA